MLKNISVITIYNLFNINLLIKKLIYKYYNKTTHIYILKTNNYNATSIIMN